VEFEMLRYFLPICLLLISVTADARVYQWVNPDTGNVQFSGKPPSWYRGQNPGPRVLVFENGRLIDDTSRSVQDQQRLAIRKEAFSQGSSIAGGEAALRGSSKAPSSEDEQVRELLDAKRQAAARMKQAEPEVAEVEEVEEVPLSPEESIDRLKQVIADYDRRKTEEAKSLLDSAEKALRESEPTVTTPAGALAP
jgi:hypothetical protein